MRTQKYKNLTNLNSNKLFSGVIVIVLMMGSKYIKNELSETHEIIFDNVIVRRIIIFCTIFMTTRDIYLSLFLTLIFIIFISLTHKDSKCCILPKKMTRNKKNYKKCLKKEEKNYQNYLNNIDLIKIVS